MVEVIMEPPTPPCLLFCGIRLPLLSSHLYALHHWRLKFTFKLTRPLNYGSKRFWWPEHLGKSVVISHAMALTRHKMCVCVFVLKYAHKHSCILAVVSLLIIAHKPKFAIAMCLLKAFISSKHSCGGHSLSECHYQHYHWLRFIHSRRENRDRKSQVFCCPPTT